MKFSDLIENGATNTKKQEHLAGGEMTAITVRIPMNLRDAGKEAAALRGMSFSTFIRICMINELLNASSGRLSERQ